MSRLADIIEFAGDESAAVLGEEVPWGERVVGDTSADEFTRIFSPELVGAYERLRVAMGLKPVLHDCACQCHYGCAEWHRAYDDLNTLVVERGLLD